jgi:1-phosphofructokinase
MIVTLTPNPSHDQTVMLPGPLARGEVIRADSTLTQAGGKGVNISRASVAAGIPSIAVLPAAGDDPYVLELLSAGIDCRPVRTEAPVRVNITVTEPDGTTTKINSLGSTVSPEVLDELADSLARRAAAADWIVLAGSLPPGTPAGWYADLVALLRSTPARLAVDTSDEPLQALVDRLPESAPHLMKPNADELASLTGNDPDRLEKDPEAVAKAAGVLLDRGVEAVLATLGAHGAVLVTGAGAWRATPPPVDVLSTVGAGDSSLFGYLLGHLRDAPPAERLALAVAYGTAAAGLPGTTIPNPAQVKPDLVVVDDLNLTPGR